MTRASISSATTDEVERVAEFAEIIARAAGHHREGYKPPIYCETAARRIVASISSTPATTDEVERLTDALEPLANLAGSSAVNMNDPLSKWFTVAQLHEAKEALLAALSPAKGDARYRPCDGAQRNHEHATFDQSWCLASGRYCKHATVQACRQ